MKRILFLLLAGLFFAGVTQAQDRTIVIQNKTLDYFSIRVGVWFPKDLEKQFSTNNVSLQQVDQSQAIGFDFHYRYDIGRPLMFDFSVGGWYSSYVFKYREVIQDPSLVQEANAWAAVVPITLGLSINLLPETPIQPHVGAGIGGYVGTSGTTEYVGINPVRTKFTADKTLFTFGGYVEASVDLFVSPAFGFNIGAKYQIVNFKEELLTKQKVFSGVQLLVGITTRI